jgi:hypothetical protein
MNSQSLATSYSLRLTWQCRCFVSSPSRDRARRIAANIAKLPEQAYLGHRNIAHNVGYIELSPTEFKNFWRE